MVWERFAKHLPEGAMPVEIRWEPGRYQVKVLGTVEPGPNGFVTEAQIRKARSAIAAALAKNPLFARKASSSESHVFHQGGRSSLYLHEFQFKPETFTLAQVFSSAGGGLMLDSFQQTHQRGGNLSVHEVVPVGPATRESQRDQSANRLEKILRNAGVFGGQFRIVPGFTIPQKGEKTYGIYHTVEPFRQE